MNHTLPPTGHWPYFGGPMNHILPPTGRALVAPGITHYHPLSLFWWPHESHITTHWPYFGGPMNHTFPQLALFSGAFLVRVLARPITRRGIDAIGFKL